MARAALNISNAELADAAKVGVNTVSRFEQGEGVRSATVAAIRVALEARGLVFLGSGEVSLVGGVGVRLPQLDN